MSACRLLSLGLLAAGSFAFAGGLRTQSPPLDVIAPLKGHTDAVEAIAVSPDGLFAATACFDRTVRLFDAATGREVRDVRRPARARGAGAERGVQPQGGSNCFRRGRQRGQGVGRSGVIRREGLPCTAARIVVAADGKTIGVAGANGIKLLPKGDEKDSLDLKGHKGAVTHLGFAGNTWVSVGADKTLRTWAADGKAGGTYSLAGLEVTGLAVGGAAYTASTDGYLRAWQLPPPPTRSFPILKDGVTAFYASADGNTLLFATADKTISLGTTANNTVATTFSSTKSKADATRAFPGRGHSLGRRL